VSECSISGCRRTTQSRNLCAKHYLAWRKRFSAQDMPFPPKTDPPDGAVALLKMLDGRITYRQLDYWIRIGAINIAHDGNGSGNHRRFTVEETTAIAALVDLHEQTTAMLDDIRSGRAYTQLLAHQRGVA